nr:hypothetical protein [Tanacetum cinerariifolium]
QDIENIAKTSAMPHEALPRVTSLGGGKGRAANILASGGLRSVFTTTSLSVATASTGVSPAGATASESFPTAVIFTTASVATPTTRVTRSSRGVVIGSSSLISVNISPISKKDKGKRKMTEPEQPSKEKVLEQISVQLAKDLEAKFAREDQIIREQAERDSEIAKIHTEKELKMMIAELDRSNEMVAKYLSKYEQAEVGLLHDEKVDLIDELLMYQRHLAQIKKYQAWQNKPTTKTERRNFYMSILRSNAGWKAKDFKGMTFEHIEEKCIPEQQSEEPKELFEEELKKMMELVPAEELYIEAIQAQEVEILRLKEMVQVLEDREGGAAKQSRDDAPIKGRSINEEDAATERISNDSEDIARVLTSIDVATVLAGGIDVPTGSGSIPTAGPPATVISTGSKVGPTASPIVGPTASLIKKSFRV